MKTFLLVALTALSGSVLFGQTAEEILTNYEKAIGSDKASKKVNSMVINATMNLPQGMTGKAVFMQKKGKKIRMQVNVEAQGMAMEMVQACDGTDCYMSNSMMGTNLLEGQEKESLLNQGDFLGENSWRDKYTSTKYIGKADVKGEQAHKIEVETPAGAKSTQYYAIDSGLMVKVETTVKGPMGEMATETFLKDYKDVGEGLKIPMLTEQVAMGMETKIVINEVNINTEVPDSKFDLPAGLK